MTLKSQKQFFAVLIVGTLASMSSLLGGCAKEADSADASFSTIYRNSFSVGCQNCHAPGASASNAGTNLDMSNESNAYNDLLNRAVQSRSNPSKCTNLRRVNPGNANSSYLLGTLSASYSKNDFGNSAGCTPYQGHITGFTNLTSGEISAIEAWITAGAKP